MAVVYQHSTTKQQQKLCCKGPVLSWEQRRDKLYPGKWSADCVANAYVAKKLILTLN